MATTSESIQEIYIGLLGRAADKSGIDYWTAEIDGGTLSLEQLRANIVNEQAEYAAGLGSLTRAQTVGELYSRMFERTADATDLEYWVNGGGASVNVDQLVLALSNGASAADRLVLDNKTDAAEFYTANITTYTADSAKAAVDSVDSTQASVDASKQSTTDGTLNAGTTFTLTTAADTNTGGDLNDVFVATESTLGSSDVLTGGAGDDTFRYASSDITPTNTAVSEAGFTTTGIETVQVTADNTLGTTFDMTGVTGSTTLNNNNSSQNLTVTGVSNAVAIGMTDVSGGNTTVQYKDTVLSGAADAQTITLNGNANNAGAAASTLSIGNTTSGGVSGLETLNITTSGAASFLTDIVTGAATINVAGDQNLTVVNQLDDATTINASAMTGNLSVVADSAGTAQDVAITGGTGDDTANFSAGFEAQDSFDGGEGTDTLGLLNAVATGTPGGTLTNVEILDVTDAGTGTINMDNFSGVSKVIYNAGLTNGAVAMVDEFDTATTVEVDATATATADLTIDLETDGTADVVTVEFDAIDAGDSMDDLIVDDAETLNLSFDDDTTTSTGTFTLGDLNLGDTTTLNLSGDAALTITTATNPTTPVLTALDASGMTDTTTISGINTSASGATITLGAGNDVYNVGTSNGADTIALAAGGNDRIVYTAVAQSDTDMDTITGFTSGSDSIDLRTFANAVTASSQFVGVKSTFGQAQGALSATGVSVVFQADENILWVDDGDGTLDNTDFRVKLDGVTTITAADLMLGTSGNTVTLTATGATVSTTVNTNASAVTTNEDDSISGTAAFANGSTVTGGLGTDTVTITSDVNALGAMTVDLTNAAGGQALDMALTGVEAVVFSNQAAATNVNIANRNAGEDITVNGADAAVTVTTTANNQDIVVSNTTGTTASAVTLHNGTGLTVNLGAAGDTVGAVQTADATVVTGAGNDTVTVTSTNAGNATLTGGTGTDTLAVTGATTITLGSNITGFETLNLNDAGTAQQQVTLSDGFTTVTMGDATDTVTGTASRVAALTTIDGTTDGDGVLTISSSGNVDLTDATIGGTNDLATLNFAAAGNNVSLDNAGLLAFQAVTGGAGTDTLTLDLEGGAITAATAGTGGDGVITAVENLVVLDSAGTAGTINLTATNASGITSINTSAVTTAQTVDISGLTTANGNTTVTLGSGNDTIATSITGAGNNNLVMNFGTGNATVADIAAGGTGTFTFGLTQGSGTQALTFSATTADLATGDKFDFATAATSIVTTGAGNAGQVIVTAGANTVILFDANGDNAFGTGDTQITLTGQNLAATGLSIDASGDLVLL